MKNKWLKVLLLTTIFFVYLLPPIDTDLGWRLRYGKHIFETRSAWKTNQIGFFLSDYQWAHSYSLYQLTSFVIYQYLGFWGLTILTGLIITGVFFFLFKTYQKKFLWPTMGSLFIILISNPVTNLGYRSQLFSLLGVSYIFYLVLTKEKFSLIQIVGLTALFTLWANLHGGFLLGLILLIFYGFEKLCQKNKKEALNIVIIAFVTALAALFNPFGWRIYSEVLRHSWYPLNKLIAEWVPPNNTGLFFLFIVIAIVVLNFISKKISLEFFKREKSLFLILSWLFFTYLAFKARRHLPLFGLASIHFLAASFSLPKIRFKKLKLFQLSVKGFMVFFLLGIMVWRLKNLPDLSKGWSSICELSKWTLPCDAVEYLKTKSPETCQQIFNAYEWGGYLAWHLPERKTFVDGRMPTWPSNSAAKDSSGGMNPLLKKKAPTQSTWKLFKPKINLMIN